MTQVTKAMGEVPRALPQIYYSIDGHEKGREREKIRERGRVDEKGREGKEVGCGVSRNRMKFGGRVAGAREGYKQMNVGPE
jgi:hypothetical protein